MPKSDDSRDSDDENSRWKHVIFSENAVRVIEGIVASACCVCPPTFAILFTIAVGVGVKLSKDSKYWPYIALACALVTGYLAGIISFGGTGGTLYAAKKRPKLFDQEDDSTTFFSSNQNDPQRKRDKRVTPLEAKDEKPDYIDEKPDYIKEREQLLGGQ